jgi:hypothetical protein
VLINPGPDQVLLDRRHLRLLYREYAVQHSRQSNLWAPSRNGSLLAVEMSLEGVMAVPAYLEQQDAVEMAQRHGGVATQVTWEQVRERCRQVSADAVLLQHGKPEEVPVSRRQLASLCADGAVVDPLDAVDVALGITGHERAAAVCESLARCERIWVIADRDRDVVTIGNVFDLFTSATDAAVLIRRLGLSGKAVPLIVPAQGLFEAMAPKGVPVAVNRGGGVSWQGDERALTTIAALGRRFGMVQ